MQVDNAKIVFRKIRNLSEVVGVSTEFMRRNYKIIIKALLAIAFPLIFLGLLGNSIFTMMMLTGMKDVFGGMANQDDLSLDAFSRYAGLSWLFMLISYLGTIMVTAVIYEFARLYAEYDNPNLITVNEIWTRVKANVGMYILTTLGVAGLILLSIFPFYIVLAAGVFLVVTIHWVIAIPIFFILIALYVYFLVPFSLTYVVRLVEGKGVIAAYSRTAKLMANKRWKILWLFVLDFLICYSVVGIPSLLVSGFVYGLTFIALKGWEPLIVVLQIVQGVVSMFTIVFIAIVSVFLYFSLVEQHENIGTLSIIPTIAQHLETEDDTVNNSFES